MNNLFKRSLSLLLTIVMALSMVVTASAEEKTLAKGDKILNDCFEVAANPSTNGWTVSGEGADTVLSITDTSAQQKILQLKNLMEERTLILDYETSGNATIQIKVGSGGNYPTAVSGSGSWEGRVPAGETVYFRKNKAGSITISNIKFDPDEAAVNVTFQPAEHGSYTVDGEPITEAKTIEKTTLESYALAATPAEGYEFVGWYDLTNGIVLSAQQEYTLSVLSDISVTAMFAKPASDDGNFCVNDRYYDVFDDARTYAVGIGADTIVLAKDYTLTEDLTVPAGITLLIPYNDAHTCFTNDFTVDGQHPSVANEYSTPSPYRILTVADGVTLTVNGKLSVSGQHYASSGSSKYYGPSGPLGYVYLQSGAQIVVNGGLYAYGYVYGPGGVTVNSGAEVYELMQIAGFRGGSATLLMAQDSRGVFPLSQYYVQNVESAMTLKAGAVEYVATSLKPGGENAITASVAFIHPTSGMFRMSEGELVKTYDGTTDRLDLDVNGVGSINSLVVSVPGVADVNSANFVLPITNNISINVKGGSVALGQDIAFLPGTQVNVAAGAAVEVETGNKVFVYDRDQWVMEGNYFSYETGKPKVRLNPILFAPGKDYTRTEADLVDAKIVVDGTMIVKGEAYTTESGAEIVTNNHKGYVIFEANAGTETETYQYDQSKLLNRYVSISIDPIRLKNGDTANEPYTETADAMAGNTYGWSEEKDMWVKGLLLTFDANGGQGTMEPQFMEIVNDGTAEEDTIHANAFTREGYKFVGWAPNLEEDEAWYVDEDRFGGDYDGNFFNTTLYAVWEPVTKYDVTWLNDNGTPLAVTQVAKGDHPVYSGENPIKASTVESDFDFAGWTDGTNTYGVNDELPAVTGPITYTAVFNPTPRQYRVSYNANGGTGTMAPEFVAYGTDHTLSENTFTYYGYEFTGWNTAADGSGTAYADKATFTVSGDLTLYAQWNVKTVTVRFLNDDEQTVLSIIHVQQGTSPSFPGEEPTKDPDVYYNYTFAGWKLGNNKYTKNSLLPPVENDTDFVAYYTASKRNYNVIFDPAGGYFQGIFQQFGNQITPPIGFEAGDKITMPTVLKNGHTFLGWSKNADGSGALIDAGAQYEVLEGTTFYAVWQVNQYTITFMPGEGGEGSMESMTYNFGETKTLTPNAFTRTGYEFAGWKDQYGNSFTDAQSITYRYTENLILTAQWNYVLVEYTVTFNVNGGSPMEMDEFDIAAGETFALPTSEKTGYTLMWKDAETGEQYAPGTNYTVTKNVNFVAVWTPISYTITWKNDDGSVIDTTTVEYGVVPTHADASKENTAEYTYTFAGWNPEVVAVTGDAEYTATFTATKNSYKITWKNDDGSVIDTTTVEYGVVPTHADATKENTAEYTYTFAGWNPEVVAVTGDAEYTATFTATKNSYKITWKNDDGSVIDTTTVEYGVVPTHADATKENTAEYTYTFAGWNPEVVAVTGDAEYTATFTATKNSYKITWKNDDGSVIDTTTVEYGVVPTHADATKENTAEYTYTFAGWNPEVVAVTGDAEYTATFTATKNSYKITWKNDDGSVIDTTTVEYGVVPTHADATKENTAEYTYTFAGWNPEVVAVTGDAEYTATFTATKNSYKITWKNDDGSVIDTTTVEYGVVPTHADATKENTAEYTYTFAGWNPEVVAVTGDAEYTATFTATKNSYKITWKNDDGSVIDTTTVEYGVVPTHADATKENTAEYTYTFAGWNPEVVAVTGDAEYTATFTATKNSYKITWKNDDGSVIDTTTVEYGVVPTHADATKENTAEYTYTFAGWNPEVVAVTEDATYTAKFTATKNSYKITWKNDDGSVIDTTTVEYGVVPTHADATKAAAENEDGTYTFKGWTPEIAAVTCDASYTAQFSYTGWRSDEVGKQYFIDNELQKTGLTEIGGKKYYLDPETGYAAVSTIVAIDADDPGHAFDADGVWLDGCTEQVFTDKKTGDIYLIKDGIVVVYPGLWQDPETKYFYYFGGDEGEAGNKAIRDTDAWVEKNHADPNDPGDRGMLPKWGYVFDENGVIVHDDVTLNGIVETEPGVYYYYIDGVKVHYGMFYKDGYYYYAKSDGGLVTSRTYWCTDNYDTGFPEGPYTFDEFGRMIINEQKNGIYEEDGSLFYYVDGNRTYLGLAYLEAPVKYHAANGSVTDVEAGYYYVKGTGEVIHSRSYWITKTNDLEGFPQGAYEFADNGKMIIPEPQVVKNGVYEEDGTLWYYVDNVKTYAGLIHLDNDTKYHAADGTVTDVEPGYYYVKGSGEMIHGRSYWITKTNGIDGFKEGAYNFATNGKIIISAAPEVKSGIYEENGSLYYYEEGKVCYAGLIYLDGNTKSHSADGTVSAVEAGYYYVKGTGEMIHGRSYWITKTNGIEGFKEGAYTFDDNGRIVL